LSTFNSTIGVTVVSLFYFDISKSSLLSLWTIQYLYNILLIGLLPWFFKTKVITRNLIFERFKTIIILLVKFTRRKKKDLFYSPRESHKKKKNSLKAWTCCNYSRHRFQHLRHKYCLLIRLNLLGNEQEVFERGDDSFFD